MKANFGPAWDPPLAGWAAGVPVQSIVPVLCGVQVAIPAVICYRLADRKALAEPIMRRVATAEEVCFICI